MYSSEKDRQEKADVQYIARVVSILQPAGTKEIRALGIQGHGRPFNAGGYFRDDRKLADAVVKLEQREPKAIYLPMNLVNPDLFSRAPDRITDHIPNTAADKDILRRHWILIDVDPKRPADISSTDAELAAAEALAADLRDWLTEEMGWLEPIEAMSGNGWHLLFPVDLPNDEPTTALVKKILDSAKVKADQRQDANRPNCKVDTAVFNAGRITKLYGTMVRKGFDTPERPHRRSYLAHVPDHLGTWELRRVIPRERLQAVASLVPEPARPVDSRPRQNGDHRLMVDVYLRDAGVEFRHERADTGRDKYIIDPCLFNPDHKGKDAAIFQGAEGKLGYHCFHDSCQDRTWQDVKRELGEPKPHHWNPPKTDWTFSKNGKNGKHKSADKLPASEVDSMPEARRFLSQHVTHQENGKTLLTLRNYQDQFHAWDSLKYVPLQDSDIKAKVWRHFDTFTSHMTITAGNNMMAAIKALTLVPSSRLMPSWLDGKGEFPPEELLATKSGLLHLPSLIAGQPSLLPLTPRFFSPNGLDYDFNPEAMCPAWLEFLDSVWPADRESIETLQMVMGYLLLPDTRQHKLFMLMGPKRSGKGTIGRVIKALVGPGNIASPTLASLAGPFGKWPLLGRTVALIADARLSGRTDAIAVVETLLSISGEDPQDVHRKNLCTITGIRLPVRFVILTNELPNMRDSSGAFTSRIILLRMMKTFYGREDKRLTEKLLSEISGILNWSIMGWQRLQEQGAFDQPESAKQLLEELEDLASPVLQFIEDSCETEGQSTASELFAGWKGWCRDHGRDHTGTRETLAKDLRTALPELNTSRPRIDGKRETLYHGIRLRIDATRIFD